MAYNVKTNSLTKEWWKTKRILLFNDSCKKWDMVVSVNNVFKLMNDVILWDTYNGIVWKVEEDSKNASTKPVLVTLFDDTMTVNVAVEDTGTWEVVEATVQWNILQDIVEETIEDIEEDKSYAYRFLNYDWSVLQEGRMMKGTAPTYTGSIPTKEPTVDTVYTFSWWEPAIWAFEEDTDLTAQFTESVRTYTVTFKNYDDTVLQTSQVAYGTVPTYTGATPTRPNWTFDGWDSELVAVTADTVYTATFIVYSYQSFSAWELSEEIRQQDPDLDVMQIDGIKKVYMKWETTLSEEYLACWEYYQMWWDMQSWLVFVKSNANLELVDYVLKTRQDLWDNYYTYQNAFMMPENMNDTVWNVVSWFFISEVHVSTSWNLITIDLNWHNSIIVNSVSHNIRYNDNYYVELLANEVLDEYTTLVTNWWLVDGTYQLADDTTINGILSSIKTKGSTWNILYNENSNNYVTTSFDFMEAHVNVRIDWGNIYRYADNQKIILTQQQETELTNYITTNKSSRWTTFVWWVANTIFIPDWVVSWTITWATVTDILANATFVSPLWSVVHDLVNQTLLITDWTNWYVISDRNAWATKYYWESQAIADEYSWKLYQRGNDYWFPISWEFLKKTMNDRVDTSVFYDGERPNLIWKWYNDEHFVPINDSPFDWTINWNLGNRWWTTTKTVEDMKWPCPAWFHIPTKDEFDWLMALVNKISWQVRFNGDKELTDSMLLLPPSVGRIYYTGERDNSNTIYWTTDSGRALKRASWIKIYTTEGEVFINAIWWCIRPFKNVSIIDNSPASWVFQYRQVTDIDEPWTWYDIYKENVYIGTISSDGTMTASKYWINSIDDNEIASIVSNLETSGSAFKKLIERIFTGFEIWYNKDQYWNLTYVWGLWYVKDLQNNNWHKFITLKDTISVKNVSGSAYFTNEPREWPDVCSDYVKIVNAIDFNTIDSSWDINISNFYTITRFPFNVYKNLWLLYTENGERQSYANEQIEE